jgi:hypothetical protein
MQGHSHVIYNANHMAIRHEILCNDISVLVIGQIRLNEPSGEALWLTSSYPDDRPTVACKGIGRCTADAT